MLNLSGMTPPLDPLEPRNMSSGLAKRTLKNLDFIKNAALAGEDVHPVTQAVNSLLGLLVFPVEKEKNFLAALRDVKFDDHSDLQGVCVTLTKHLPVPSLRVTQFEKCKDLGCFFVRVRNAISHKHLEFSGDSDSRVLADVQVTLKDRQEGRPFNWEITMNAEDLERLSRYVAKRVIDQGL